MRAPRTSDPTPSVNVKPANTPTNSGNGRWNCSPPSAPRTTFCPDFRADEPSTARRGDRAHRRRRRVPETANLDAPQRCLGRPRVRGRADEGQGEPHGAGSSVGAGPPGGPMRRSRRRRSAVPGAWRRLLEAAKLRLDGMVQPGRRARRSADDHAARSATYVRGLAVSSGANVLAVSRMLGHKDPSVTLRIYADLFDSDLDAVAVSLDARISVSVQTVSTAPVDRRRPRRISAV